MHEASFLALQQPGNASLSAYQCINKDEKPVRELE
jgi:hypothetical protein